MNVLGVVLIMIQQASPTATAAASDTNDPLKFWVQVGSLLGALIGLLTFLTKGVPWLKARRDRRSIQKRIGAESYTPAGIENAFRNFIPPMCQDVDPSGGDEPRNVYGVKQPLFSALDDALRNPEANKYFILLADSGMGKTTALLNYYLRHIRWLRDPGYKLALIPLNIPDADERIEAVPNKEDTVLFLDALDEDTLAIVDYVERLRILLNATLKFRAVLISCRTQFFSKDEEIPKETGRIRIADRRAGQEAEYVFQKIYLSPFSDAQVKKYLRRKYSFWRQDRKAALRVAKKIPHLTARPMLLAHIDDLLRSKKEFRFSFELYEAMVEAWLKRERGLVKEIDALRNFSEMLAVDLYVYRSARKAEKVPERALPELAEQWGVPVENWKLSGRSLLNRDAEGNFKFAHRSIMEHLFVKRFLAGDSVTTSTAWTDQMSMFLYEHLVASAGGDLFPRGLPRQNFELLMAVNGIGRLLDSVVAAAERGVSADPIEAARIGTYIISCYLNSKSYSHSDVTWIHLRGMFATDYPALGFKLSPVFVVSNTPHLFRADYYPKGRLIHASPRMGVSKLYSNAWDRREEFSKLLDSHGVQIMDVTDAAFEFKSREVFLHVGPRQHNMLSCPTSPPLRLNHVEALLQIFVTFSI